MASGSRYASLSAEDWKELFLNQEIEAEVEGRKGTLGSFLAFVQRKVNSGDVEEEVLEFAQDFEKSSSVFGKMAYKKANKDPSWAPRRAQTREAADRLVSQRTGAGRGTGGGRVAVPSGGGPRVTSGPQNLTLAQAEDLMRRAYAQWPGRATA